MQILPRDGTGDMLGTKADFQSEFRLRHDGSLDDLSLFWPNQDTVKRDYHLDRPLPLYDDLLTDVDTAAEHLDAETFALDDPASVPLLELLDQFLLDPGNQIVWFDDDCV